MDLWRLHVFCSVLEHGGFSRAAEAVHLSQPTVSSHIKHLEEHFGCKLLDRLGRNAAPTKAGELLYGFAQRLLALRDETENAMAAFLGRPGGRLTVGGSTIPGSYILPQVIGAFAASFPQATVSLVIADTREIVDRTLEGRVEVGLVGARVADNRLEQAKLFEDELRLVVPANHRFAKVETVSLSELAGELFIVREPGSGTRRTMERFLAQAGLDVEKLRVAAEMGNTEAVREGVKAGIGVSVLSTRAVARELAEGSLCAVAVEGMEWRRPFYLVRHRQRTPSPLCSEFCKFLKQKAGA